MRKAGNKGMFALILNKHHIYRYFDERRNITVYALILNKHHIYHKDSMEQEISEIGVNP